MADNCSSASLACKKSQESNGYESNGYSVNDKRHSLECNGDNKDNNFGATVIKSRAVNYLLTKLRCKETSGRVKFFMCMSS